MDSKEKWIGRLKKMRRNIFLQGEKVDRDDPRMQKAIATLAVTYDFAKDRNYADLFTAKSHISGEKINRFCHIHQNKEDLHKKQDMTRLICRKVGGCILRCMGTDAINAISCVSYEADKANKGTTDYYNNFMKWLNKFQREDLIGCCAQTDVKGNRVQRPHQQKDPDAYVRVVEKKSDGIIVRGAKIHITVAAQADEILVIPTRAMHKEDKDWSVSFAIPADWEGVKQIVRLSSVRPRKIFKKGFETALSESMVIFEDVFIPWERVFLCGETQQAGILALLFALFHRHSYCGCKPAVTDLFMGAVALAAEYNGVHREKHIRDKLAELIMLAELSYSAGFTAAELSGPQLHMQDGPSPYGPGTFIPNSIYANVGRCLSGESYYHEMEILADVSGGAPATLPYEEDWNNSETKHLLEKYSIRNPDISPKNQHLLWRHIGDILCSAYGGAFAMAGVHGGGSPIMEKIAIGTQYDIEGRKEMVRQLAGIK